MDRHPVQPPQLEGGAGRERVPAGGAHQGVPDHHQEAGQGVPPREPRDIPGECGAWPVAVDCGEEIHKLHWSSHKPYIFQRSVIPPFLCMNTGPLIIGSHHNHI